MGDYKVYEIVPYKPFKRPFIGFVAQDSPKNATRTQRAAAIAALQYIKQSLALRADGPRVWGLGFRIRVSPSLYNPKP